jgi:sulfur carrier protein
MRVNGETLDAAPNRLSELLAARGIDPAARYLAVAVNGAVVPRSGWANCRLADSDEIEIVRPREGG